LTGTRKSGGRGPDKYRKVRGGKVRNGGGGRRFIESSFGELVGGGIQGERGKPRRGPSDVSGASQGGLVWKKGRKKRRGE